MDLRLDEDKKRKKYRVFIFNGEITAVVLTVFFFFDLLNILIILN